MPYPQTSSSSQSRTPEAWAYGDNKGFEICSPKLQSDFGSRGTSIKKRKSVNVRGTQDVQETRRQVSQDRARKLVDTCRFSNSVVPNVVVRTPVWVMNTWWIFRRAAEFKNALKRIYKSIVRLNCYTETRTWKNHIEKQTWLWFCI